jgi:hypothetical protein
MGGSLPPRVQSAPTTSTAVRAGLVDLDEDSPEWVSLNDSTQILSVHGFVLPDGHR